MKRKEIEIVIDQDGNVQVEARGFRGRTCAAATKDFLEALGGSQCEKKKSEWYQTEKTCTRQVVKQGS